MATCRVCRQALWSYDAAPQEQGVVTVAPIAAEFTDEVRRIAPQLLTCRISVKFTRTNRARPIMIHADPSFDHSVAPHDAEALKVPM